jgi:hypothetical protein
MTSEPWQVVDTGWNPNSNENSESDELHGWHPEGVQVCSFCLYVVEMGTRAPNRKMAPRMRTAATAFPILSMSSLGR